MAEIAELGFRIDSAQTVKAAKDLDKLTAASGRTETATQRAEREWRKSQATLRGMGRDLQFITGLMKGFAAGFAGLTIARHLQRVADGYSNVQAKLRLVTADQAQLGRVSEQVFALSQRTYSSLDSTATLVSRTTRALVSNGAEASAALASSLRLSETIQKAFAVSGATTAEASNAIIQLSQGLSAGALRGEEYNSVAEQGSRITQALAASLGKTTGELREMAAEGKLTAEIIQRALTQQAAAIDAEFAKLPLTIERSLVNLENAWSRFIGQADQAAGASRTIAEAIAGLARNLESVADAALVVAGVVAASFAGRALQGVQAYAAAVMQSVAATSASVEMERLAAAQAVATAQAERAAAQAAVGQAEAEVMATQATIRHSEAMALAANAAQQQAGAEFAVRRGQLENIQATIAATEQRVVASRAHAQAAQSAGAQSFALRELAIAETRLTNLSALRAVALTDEAAAQARMVTATKAREIQDARHLQLMASVVAMEKQLIASKAALAAANGGLGAADSALMASQKRAADAMKAAPGLFSKAAGAVARLGSGLLALAGGPIGVAIMALGAMYISMKNSEEAAAAFEARIKSTTQALDDFARTGTAGDLEALFNPDTGGNRAAELIAELNAELRIAQNEAATAAIRMTAIGRGSGADLQRARERIAELNAELEKLRPRFEAASAAFVDFTREAFGFGKSARTVAADMNEWFKSMGETEEKLISQRIELQQGHRAMLEYGAMQAAGVKAVGELSAAVTAQIDRLVKEKAAIDAANEAKREASKTERDNERDMRRTEKAIDKAIEQQERYETTLIRMRAELKGPVARAQAEFEANLKDVEHEMMQGNVSMTQYYDTLELMEQAHLRAAEAARTQEEEEANIRGSVDALLASMQLELELSGMTSDAREQAVAGMDAEEAMLRAINAANEKGAKIDKKRTDELVKQARALAADAVEGERLQDVLSRINNTPIGNLLRNIEELKEKLQDALNPELAQAYEFELSQMNLQLGQEMVGSLRSATDAMAGLFDEGSKGQKKMQQASAALMVVQAALASVEAVRAVLKQATEGDPYSAFARMAAMAAAVAPLIAAIGGAIPAFSGGPGSSGAEARQAAQGRGTVLGDAEAQSESMVNALEITADATSELVGINRGMLRALESMQAGIGAASGSLARTGFADLSLDSAMGPLLDRAGNTIAGRIFGAIFGGDQDLIDQGLLIGGGSFGNVSRDPRASSFQTIETDGGWFGSDDIDDELEALGQDATNQIRLILESIGDAVAEGARALGLDMEEVDAAIEAFRIEEIRISTMDLTGEEAQRELEAVFSTIFDGLAGHVVPFVAQFQRVGEGLGETLVRVATSVQVAQEGIYQLGLTVDTLDPERMAQMSVALVEAAGGIEEFISGMQSFVASFAPESHQFAIAQDSLTRALAEVGLVVPETRTGMWELMQSLDATTESGRAQIATLLRLAGVADSYYDMLEDGADAATEAARALADAAAAAAEEAATALSILLGVANDRAYSNMTTAQRAIADVNSRFSDLRVQLNATNPTLEEAAELERARTQAIDDATAALRAQGQELIGELLFEESLVGLTEVQTAIANINREFDGYVETLIDLGFAEDSAEVATINRIRAARLLRAEEDAVAESTRGLTVSFTDMRDSMVAIIQDLRAQFEHLMDPGFRSWIEGLTGISPHPQSDMVTRSGTISTVQHGYAGAISSIGMQIAAAQAQLAALGSISVGPERALLKSRIEMLRAMLLDVTGTMSEAVNYVNDLFDQQIGDLLATLREEFGTEDEIGKINARFDKLIEQATAWGASVEQLAEIEQFRMMALMRAQEDMYESQLAQIRHLQGFLDGMLLSPDSPLSATERTEEAWAQFQAAVEAGNVEEATRLADVYLQLLRESQASGEDFNSQFWAVRDILTAMRDGLVESITDDATEQYLADIAAGGVMQLHALDRLNAVMDSIRVALGGTPVSTSWSDGTVAATWMESSAPQGYYGSDNAVADPALAAEFALLREELAAIKEAVRAGSDNVARTVDKTGERSDRTNDTSRSRHARPPERSFR